MSLTIYETAEVILDVTRTELRRLEERAEIIYQRSDEDDVIRLVTDLDLVALRAKVAHLEQVVARKPPAEEVTSTL